MREIGVKHSESNLRNNACGVLAVMVLIFGCLLCLSGGVSGKTLVINGTAVNITNSSVDSTMLLHEPSNSS